MMECEQGKGDRIYCDFSSIAPLAYFHSRMHKLNFPVQTTYGDCWLWSTVACLHMQDPSLFVNMIDFFPTHAQVNFPRGGKVCVDYTFTTLKGEPLCAVAMRRCDDLYWGLLAKAICVKLQGRSQQIGCENVKYNELNGGLVSDALTLLAKNKYLSPVFLTSKEAFLATNERGILVCEENRSGTLHSLGILGIGEDGRMMAWDPWGYKKKISLTDSVTILFHREIA